MSEPVGKYMQEMMNKKEYKINQVASFGILDKVFWETELPIHRELNINTVLSYRAVDLENE